MTGVQTCALPIYFQNFTEPLGNTINLLAKWGESGLLRQDEVELLATQFQALMEIQPTIHAITMADSNGNHIQLVHTGDSWLITEHRKDKLIISQWLDRKIVSSKVQSEKGYMAQNSIWYRGAMTTNTQQAYFLSEPYTLATSQELGITASKHWKAFDTPDTDVVTAISFTMSDLMTFMAQFEDTLNDRTLLLEKDGTLLSKFKPGIPPGAKESTAGPGISAELLKIVTNTLAKNVSNKEMATSFRYKKKIYWLGLSPLHENKADI